MIDDLEDEFGCEIGRIGEGMKLSGGFIPSLWEAVRLCEGWKGRWAAFLDGKLAVLRIAYGKGEIEESEN